MLLPQLKEDATGRFSKQRIAPMMRVTPVLRDLIGTRRMRNADETILFKSFSSRFLALAAAGSPDDLARRPVRVVLCDEIDEYRLTREGDPIASAEERTATFAKWLSVCGVRRPSKNRAASRRNAECHLLRIKPGALFGADPATTAGTGADLSAACAGSVFVSVTGGSIHVLAVHAQMTPELILSFDEVSIRSIVDH